MPEATVVVDGIEYRVHAVGPVTERMQNFGAPAFRFVGARIEGTTGRRVEVAS